MKLMTVWFCPFKYVISGALYKIFFFLRYCYLDKQCDRQDYNIKQSNTCVVTSGGKGRNACVRDTLFNCVLLLLLIATGLCCHWLLGEGSGLAISYSYLITQFFFPLSFMLDILLPFEPKIVGMYKESIQSLKNIQPTYNLDPIFYSITKSNLGLTT